MKKYRRREEEITVVEWDGTDTAKTDIVRFFKGDRTLFYFTEFGTRLYLSRPSGDREVMRGEKITMNRSGTAYVIDDDLLAQEFIEV